MKSKITVSLSIMMALVIMPLLSAEALIEKPDVQFKTFAEIQADALNKFNNPDATLTDSEARKQRFRALMRTQNIGRDRVKSGKLNFKKNSRGVRSQGVPSSQRTNKSNRRSFSFRNSRQSLSSEQIRTNLVQRNNNRRSSFDFVPQPGQIWGR